MSNILVGCNSSVLISGSVAALAKLCKKPVDTITADTKIYLVVAGNWETRSFTITYSPTKVPGAYQASLRDRKGTGTPNSFQFTAARERLNVPDHVKFGNRDGGALVHIGDNGVAYVTVTDRGMQAHDTEQTAVTSDLDPNLFTFEPETVNVTTNQTSIVQISVAYNADVISRMLNSIPDGTEFKIKKVS